MDPTKYNEAAAREENAGAAVEEVRCTCDAWRHALEAATDHERYGPAITSIAGEWTLGDTAPLAFCPWCGLAAPRL